MDDRWLAEVQINIDEEQCLLHLSKSRSQSDRSIACERTTSDDAETRRCNAARQDLGTRRPLRYISSVFQIGLEQREVIVSVNVDRVSEQTVRIDLFLMKDEIDGNIEEFKTTIAHLLTQMFLDDTHI